MANDEQLAESSEQGPVTPHDVLLVEMIQDLERAYYIALRDGGESEGAGISLNVNGMIVTGTLAAYPTWAKALNAMVGAEPPEDLDPEVGLAEVDEIHASERSTIHLVDAQFAMGPQLMPTAGKTVWRGRLSHISGWSPGRLLVGPKSND